MLGDVGGFGVVAKSARLVMLMLASLERWAKLARLAE